jgi:hypothetical protein
MIIVLIIVVSQKFCKAASPAALLATDLSEITISKFVFTKVTIRKTLIATLFTKRTRDCHIFCNIFKRPVPDRIHCHPAFWAFSRLTKQVAACLAYKMTILTLVDGRSN